MITCEANDEVAFDEGDLGEPAILTVEDCWNDEERRIRKSGIATAMVGDAYIAITNLNLLCEKALDAFGESAHILRFDGDYSAHRDYENALAYARKLSGLAVSAYEPPLLLTPEETARIGL